MVIQTYETQELPNPWGKNFFNDLSLIIMTQKCPPLKRRQQCYPMCEEMSIDVGSTYTICD
jgi:hypothetical protein